MLSHNVISLYILKFHMFVFSTWKNNKKLIYICYVNKRVNYPELMKDVFYHFSLF